MDEEEFEWDVIELNPETDYDIPCTLQGGLVYNRRHDTVLILFKEKEKHKCLDGKYYIYRLVYATTRGPMQYKGFNSLGSIDYTEESYLSYKEVLPVLKGKKNLFDIVSIQF